MAISALVLVIGSVTTIGTTFQVGSGYILGLPVAAYLTWQGVLIKGKGISPSVAVELSPDHLIAGDDTQMQRALELTKSM